MHMHFINSNNTPCASICPKDSKICGPFFLGGGGAGGRMVQCIFGGAYSILGLGFFFGGGWGLFSGGFVFSVLLMWVVPIIIRDK